MGELGGETTFGWEDIGLACLGGATMSLSVIALLLLSGKLTGLSSIVEGVIRWDKKTVDWKLIHFSGMLTAFIVMNYAWPDRLSQKKGLNLSWLSFCLGGFFVGMGTRLGNGCTSGHGICGCSRLSPRSILAVVLFMSMGICSATVAYLNKWGMSAEQDDWDKKDDSVAHVVVTMGIVVAALVVGMVRGHYAVKVMLFVFACGLVFGVGLVVSGMTIQAKILNFLIIDEDRWDGTLMFVMGSAIPVTYLGFRYILNKHPVPIFASLSDQSEVCPIDSFEIPTNTDIDYQLVIGSYLFGLGWGICGLCPGPGIGLAAVGYPKAALGFFPFLALGMYAAYYTKHFLSKKKKGEEELEVEGPSLI